MRCLVHLSDLHFGRTERELIEPLIATVRQLKPDVVVVSGDLTQDARDEEFAEARQFLDALPEPRIVIPGNHDMPFYNPLRRLACGLDGYRRWIATDLEPCYSDDELTVTACNTARLWPVRGGRINEKQIARVAERMSAAAHGVLRVLATHHPFDLGEQFNGGELVGRADLAMERLARSVDVLLAGHMHVAHSGHTAVRYKRHGHSAIFVQAGTAISTRVRGEQNSFNVLRLRTDCVVIERFAWQSVRKMFVAGITDYFEHGAAGWLRLPEERALDAA